MPRLKQYRVLLEDTEPVFVDAEDFDEKDSSRVRFYVAGQTVAVFFVAKVLGVMRVDED